MTKTIHLPSLLIGMVAILVLALFSSAIWQDEEVPGRYQAISGSSTSAFVLDTKTGAIVKLYLEDFGPDNMLTSEEVKKRLHGKTD